MPDPFEPSSRAMRPPGNVNNLRSRISTYARERGLSVARLNQRALTECMFGVLERARELGVIPMYLAIGGMAIELRFGIRARASGDLDIGIVTGGAPLIELFHRAIAVGFDDFTYERREVPTYLENARTYRMAIKIAYRQRPFGTLSVDLNEAAGEVETGLHRAGLLTAFGLPGPMQVPLLDPYVQIAHKLHGATEPNRPGYTNVRYRDLLDVLVMESDASFPVDLPHLRRVATAEFARRNVHPWPPVFELPDAWRSDLSRVATEVGYPTRDPERLADEFTTLIAHIDEALG